MIDLPTLYVYTLDLTRNDGAPDEQPLVFIAPRDDATPYVPASRLDAANLDIARLKALLLDARSALHGYDVTIGAIRADELPAQREEVAHRISDHLFPPTPKDPSDV